MQVNYKIRARGWTRWLLLAFTSLGFACTGLPEGTSPVQSFQLQRYLGTWYEIARLDHRFERGLTHITANYSMREDGGVAVLNQGFDSEQQQWRQAEGRAYFIGAQNEGRLKVSFFGPFYGAYNVIALDEQYRYAMVAGPDHSYLWILSRTPQLPQQILDRLIEQASQSGFEVNQLIFVPQSDRPQSPDQSGTAALSSGRNTQ